MENDEINVGFLSSNDMKRKPVFKEIFVETGHPEHAVNSVTGQLGDMGFQIESSGSSISTDDVAEGVKDYLENVLATKTEKEYRENWKTYRKFFWVGLLFSIVFGLLTFTEINLLVVAIIVWIATFVFWNLYHPKDKSDKIWIKVKGKIYSGTKAREVRDTGKQKAGITKSASSVYVHSEIKFSIAGDSEIDVERIRENIGDLSKHIQKI